MEVGLRPGASSAMDSSMKWNALLPAIQASTTAQSPAPEWVL